MSTEHTPEPWHVQPDGTLAHTSPTKRVTVSILPMERFRPNLDRAVACVNACAGIADPLRNLAGIRETLAEAADYIRNGTPIHPGSELASDLLRASEALARPA